MAGYLPLRMIDIRLNGLKCDRVDQYLQDLVARHFSDRRRDQYNVMGIRLPSVSGPLSRKC